MPAPAAIVNTAMMEAVTAPKVTSGSGASANVHTVSYKILAAADIGDSYQGSLSVFGSATFNKILARWTIGGGTVGTPTSNNQQVTTSNPSVQTVTPTTPAGIAIGIYCATGTVSPRTSGVTATRELNNGTRHYIKSIEYTSGAPASITFDMDDEGTNLLRSFWIPITPDPVSGTGSASGTGTARRLP